ncbi:MAG: hypothetical protein LBG17_00655 [Bacteroidales bacterium]|jgi:hypothetical protein|nr:hypothetical protein [Bacteroidales bacterium]
MKNKLVFFCLTPLLFLQSLNGQSYGHLWKVNDVYFQKDIKELLNKNREYNISQKIQGFKILIFSQTGNGSKSNALEAKSNFLEIFSNVPAYLVYEEPYFKVKAGNFRTRKKALEFLRIIQDVYPNSFIVQDFFDVDNYFSDDSN